MSKPSRETDRLTKIVQSFPRVTVTVLGDMVADEFVFGEISRVSREAPVLIVRHRERTVLPGGGANAVNNLADLGVNVLPVGIVGILLARKQKTAAPAPQLSNELATSSETHTPSGCGSTQSSLP